MSDGDALLAAVLANPDEDTPRLAYADWLQEHGREERAEFVRVQCAIAAPFSGRCRVCRKRLAGDRVADGCPCNGPRGINHGLVPAYVCVCSPCDPERTGGVRARPVEVERLHARARELLAQSPAAPYWSLPASLARTHPRREVAEDGPAIRCVGRRAQVVRCDFARGWVESVTCSAADWLAHGDALSAMHPVTAVRLTTWPGINITRGERQRTWKRTPQLGGQVMDCWRLEWPRVAFTLPA